MLKHDHKTEVSVVGHKSDIAVWRHVCFQFRQTEWCGHHANALRPNDAYMRQQTRASQVKISEPIGLFVNQLKH